MQTQTPTQASRNLSKTLSTKNGTRSVPLYNWTEIIKNLRQERRRIARLRNPEEQWKRALWIYGLVLKGMGRKPQDLVSQVIDIAKELSHHVTN